LDLVVLALGTNDLCGDCGPAEQAIERCLSGVQQLVDDIRSMESHIGSSTFSILVLGLPPLVSTEVNLTWKFPSNLRHVREEANDRLRIWCLEQHIDYLDISHVLTLNAIDGIHLTETDQMAMSEIVYQKLQAIYYSS
jgi:lysophospholipase L1-like esterase